MALPSKVGRRAEKKADKEAEVVIQSLRKASQGAIEGTLNGIVKILENDIPLMYHVSGLLHNEEWRAVLKSCLEAEEGTGASSASGEKPAAEEEKWKLRAGLRKFDHLKRRYLHIQICSRNKHCCNLFHF